MAAREASLAEENEESELDEASVDSMFSPHNIAVRQVLFAIPSFIKKIAARVPKKRFQDLYLERDTYLAKKLY